MTKRHRCGIAIGAGLLWLCGSSVEASIVQFSASLNGVQETPPTPSSVFGFGNFTMDTDADTLAINVFIAFPPPTGETAAHIHGFAPPGTPAGILFGLPLGLVKMATWNYSQPDEANIIAGLTYVNVHSNAFPGGEIRGQIERVPSCGDGILDAGEACDDGNVVNGDCCSSSCQAEAFGGACADDGDPCTLDECDGAGNCGVGAPRTGCRTALKSSLAMKDLPIGTKDKLLWKWLKGEAITQPEFGTPTGTTAYTLCLYAGTTSAAIGSADIPSGSSWAAISDKGYKYKATDPDALPDGVRNAILKSGLAGRAKALVKGKGTALPDLLAVPLALPVTVQLVNDANPLCLEGEYDAPDVITNEAREFKAKVQ